MGFFYIKEGTFSTGIWRTGKKAWSMGHGAWGRGQGAWGRNDERFFFNLEKACKFFWGRPG